MNVLFKYLFKYKGMCLARIFTNVSKATCSVWLSVILGNVLDGLTAQNVEQLKCSVIQCIILIVALVVISGIDIIVTSSQTEKTLNYIKMDIFSRIINGSMEKYRCMHSGKYISILYSDISVINEEFINNFFSLLFQVLSFGISLIVLLRINWMVTLIIIGISVISLIVVSKVSEYLMQQQIEFSKSMENFTKIVSDIFSGIHVIKNYNITDKMEELYSKSDEVLEEKRKRYYITVGIINIIMVIFSMMTYLTIIIFCANSVMKASLSAGEALIIVQLCSNLTNPLNEMISIASSMYSVKGIGEKIHSICYQEDESVEETIHKKDFISGISLKNISFSYEGSNEAVLKDLNINIKKGKKYALVGESGSGKSTCIKLLLKYYSKYSGEILLDDENIQKITMDEYCKIVSSMEQDTFIFDDTLRDNICLYSNYSEDEINRAIDDAGLRTIVDRMPDGLDTILGEGGSSLSGGECQRVAFARLLLKKTPILLLDEATANLDNSTTMRIENLILNKEDLTLISVTHKLVKQILQRYDEIIVMNKGRVIEQGTFDELIAKAGYFYNLYNVKAFSV